MTDETSNTLARKIMLEIQIRMEGMIAENQRCEICGEKPRYTSGDFGLLAHELDQRMREVMP